MEIKLHTLNCFGEKNDRVSILFQEIKNTREKMENETRTFIEAARSFSLEWIQRELGTNALRLESGNYAEDIETGESRTKDLSPPGDLSPHIQEIIEAHLNRDDFWIHRSGLFQADISRDYIEFKKEKIRKDLTSSVRMILGCAAEVFADMKEDPQNKVWVKERERRKYICILRFSDEMTASLDRYFTMLEYLFALEYEIKESEKEVESGES